MKRTKGEEDRRNAIKQQLIMTCKRSNDLFGMFENVEFDTGHIGTI